MRTVVIGNPGDVNDWIKREGKTYGEVITLGGMVAGRRFDSDDVVIVSDVMDLSDSDRDWLRHLRWCMRTGADLPESLLEAIR